MLKKIVLVFAAVALAKAQVPSLGWGGCPEYVPMANFDMSRFLGVWYEAERYFQLTEIISRCVTTNYTRGLDGKLRVSNEVTNRFTGIKRVLDGEIKPPASKSEEGKLFVKYTTIPLTPETQYSILETDYDNYAVLWSCSSAGPFYTQNAWLMTRDRQAPGEILQRAYGVLDKYKISKRFFFKSDQSDCDYAPITEAPKPSPPASPAPVKPTEPAAEQAATQEQATQTDAAAAERSVDEPVLLRSANAAEPVPIEETRKVGVEPEPVMQEAAPVAQTSVEAAAEPIVPTKLAEEPTLAVAEEAKVAEEPKVAEAPVVPETVPERILKVAEGAKEAEQPVVPSQPADLPQQPLPVVPQEPAAIAKSSEAAIEEEPAAKESASKSVPVEEALEASVAAAPVEPAKPAEEIPVLRSAAPTEEKIVTPEAVSAASETVENETPKAVEIPQPIEPQVEVVQPLKEALPTEIKDIPDVPKAAEEPSQPAAPEPESPAMTQPAKTSAELPKPETVDAEAPKQVAS